jgi:hypothetical protein
LGDEVTKMTKKRGTPRVGQSSIRTSNDSGDRSLLTPPSRITSYRIRLHGCRHPSLNQQTAYKQKKWIKSASKSVYQTVDGRRGEGLATF